MKQIVVRISKFLKCCTNAHSMFEIAGYHAFRCGRSNKRILTLTQLLCVRHLQFVLLDVTFAESNTADIGLDNGVSKVLC